MTAADGAGPNHDACDHGTGRSGDGRRIVIHESSPVPVREQIRSQIEGLVRIGALTAGDRLPSVRQLAGDLRVAPGTVAKAYAELAERGVIDTGLGRAARVRSIDPMPAPLLDAARSYADEARRRGLSLDDAINALRAQWR